MALILNIETATAVCSVALAKDDEIISIREDNKGMSHSAVITTFISQCLSQANITFEQLDAIAVSKGPGSYTGLRIGVATAKALCFGLDKPLIGVNTLQSLTKKFISNFGSFDDTLYCPMLDARRMEVYTAIFDSELAFKKATAAEIITANSFSEFLKTNKMVFFGDGMMKCKGLLSVSKNALFVDDIVPSASGMSAFSAESYTKGLFENPAYFEPFYLKDFFDMRQPLLPM